MNTQNQETPTFKPKKSVALSGVAAGNTALCSVGKSGNDLHYRGYDIKDLAEQFDAKPVEIKALFRNALDVGRAAQLREQMLRAGLPI